MLHEITGRNPIGDYLSYIPHGVGSFDLRLGGRTRIAFYRLDANTKFSMFMGFLSWTWYVGQYPVEVRRT